MNSASDHPSLEEHVRGDSGSEMFPCELDFATRLEGIG
jgi:hypothetical protein